MFKFNRNTALSYLMGILIISSVINCFTEIYNTSIVFPIWSTLMIGEILIFLTLFNRLLPFIRFHWIDIIVGFGIIWLIAGHLQGNSCLWNIGSLCVLILYCILRCIREINYVIIYIGVMLAAFLLAIIGYLQLLKILPSRNVHFSITGDYHNPAVYAGVMCLLLCVIVGFIIYSFKYPFYRRMRNVSLCICVFCLPVFICANSRAAWVAFMISVCCGIMGIYEYQIRSLCKSYFPTVIIFLFALSLSASYGLYKYRPDSIDGRILIGKVSLEMIKDKPVTGFGTGGFAGNYMYYQARYLKEKGTDREKLLAGSTHLAFNEPLRLLVEYGIAGLLMYIVLIGYILKPRRNHLAIKLAQMLLMAVLLWGLFAYPNRVFPMTVFTVLALALLVRMDTMKRRKILLTSRRLLFLKVAFLLLILLLGNGSLSLLPAYHQLYLLTHTAPNMISEEKVLGGYENMESLMSEEIGFCYHYCLALNRYKKDGLLKEKLSFLISRFPSPAVFVLKGDMHKRLKEFSEAEESYKMAHWMMPSLQTPRGKLAFLYQETGRKQEALLLANELLTEKVKVYGFATHELHLKLKEQFSEQLTNSLIKKSKAYEKN